MKDLVNGIAQLMNGAALLHRVFKRADSTGVSGEEPTSHSGAVPRTNAKVRVFKVANLNQRMKHIIRMVREYYLQPAIREEAGKILTTKCGSGWCTAERKWEAELKAVYTYIQQNVRYTRDAHNVDTFQSPLRTLEWKIGDCDDQSILVASLLMTVGFPIKLRVIQTKGARDWSHIYPVVGLPPQRPTRWVACDTTTPHGVGFEAPAARVVRQRDFLVRR